MNRSGMLLTFFAAFALFNLVTGACMIKPDAAGHVTVPEGVETLGRQSFNGCFELVSITLPKSLRYVGRQSFGFCHSLVTVALPDGLIYISSFAFAHCTSLHSVTLVSDAVKTLPFYLNPAAFLGCTSLLSVALPKRTPVPSNWSGEGLLEFGVSCTNNGHLWPSGCEWYYIGENVFENCISLSSIALPEGLIAIRHRTFNNCPSLSSVTLPDSLRYICHEYGVYAICEVRYNLLVGL